MNFQDNSSHDTEELIAKILTENDDIQFVNPSIEEIQTVIKILSTELPAPTGGTSNIDITNKDVLLLTDETTFREAQANFTTASALTQLVELGVVELSKMNTGQDQVVITPSELYSLVTFDGETVTVSTTNNDEVRKFREFAKSYTDKDTPRLKHPALQDVRGALNETFNDSYVQSFDEVIKALSMKQTEPPIADIFVVLSAYEGCLQKEISRLLEDIGVNSIATISRCKTKLENEDIITKNSVMQQVGRPLHRLELSETTEPHVESASDIINIVQEIQ